MSENFLFHFHLATRRYLYCTTDQLISYASSNPKGDKLITVKDVISKEEGQKATKSKFTGLTD